MTDNDGYITANVAELEKLALRLGMSHKKFIEYAAVNPYGTGLSSTTGYNIFRGKRVQIGSLKKLLEAHRVMDFELFVARDDQTESAYVAKATMTLDEWNVIETLGPVQTFPNGLQYRLHRLQHQILPDTFGRGKEYDLSHESSDDVARHGEQLIRHPKVCRRLRNSRYFPINERVVQLPGTHVFWVIDRWESSESLESRLKRGSLKGDELRRRMCELAEAIGELHEQEMIRRDLSPANIFLRDDGPLFLSELELSKLLDNSPTVAGAWDNSPYRAPEVGAASIDRTVDFYSWAQVLCHAVSGKQPPQLADPRLIERVSLPKSVKDLATRCLTASYRGRPKVCSELQDVLKHW